MLVSKLCCGDPASCACIEDWAGIVPNAHCSGSGGLETGIVAALGRPGESLLSYNMNH